MTETNDRLFIAVSVSDDIKRFLTDIQDRLKQNGIRASWVHENNMHLTLKFLGSTNGEVFEQLKTRLQKAVSSSSPFYLSAGGLGVFPSVKSPKVLWSKVTGETEKLEGLHSSVEKELSTLGFQKEKKRFHPHFTIGRTKGRVNSRTVFEMIEQYSFFRSKPYQVTGLHIFKSDLKPKGAVHTRLFTAELPFFL